MALEIKENLRKYLRLTEDGRSIEEFICPVEGCDFTTKWPGALRIHISLKSDPEIRSKYCPKHEKFYRSHSNELGIWEIRYLFGFPCERQAEEKPEG